MYVYNVCVWEGRSLKYMYMYYGYYLFQSHSGARPLKTSEVQAVHATSGHDATRGSPSGTRVRMKMTRSRAWVEEYASSNDPMKLLLAAVYDYMTLVESLWQNHFMNFLPPRYVQVHVCIPVYLLFRSPIKNNVNI